MTDLEGRALGDALAEALGWEVVGGHAFQPLEGIDDRLPTRVVWKSTELLTWAGLGVIYPELQRHGLTVKTGVGPYGYGEVEVDDAYAVVHDGDVPTAVAQAALAALGGEQ